METLENTNGAVTKIDLRWRGDIHPCPPLAMPLFMVMVRVSVRIRQVFFHVYVYDSQLRVMSEGEIFRGKVLPIFLSANTAVWFLEPTSDAVAQNVSKVNE